MRPHQQRVKPPPPPRPLQPAQPSIAPPPNEEVTPRQQARHDVKDHQGIPKIAILTRRDFPNHTRPSDSRKIPHQIAFRQPLPRPPGSLYSSPSFNRLEHPWRSILSP